MITVEYCVDETTFCPTFAVMVNGDFCIDLTLEGWLDPLISDDDWRNIIRDHSAVKINDDEVEEILGILRNLPRYK